MSPVGQPAPLEGRGPLCHQADLELCAGDRRGLTGLTEPAEAQGAQCPGLKAAWSVLSAMAAAKQSLRAQPQGSVSSQAALGVLCFPGIPDCVLSHFLWDR